MLGLGLDSSTYLSYPITPTSYSGIVRWYKNPSDETGSSWPDQLGAQNLSQTEVNHKPAHDPNDDPAFYDFDGSDSFGADGADQLEMTNTAKWEMMLVLKIDNHTATNTIMGGEMHSVASRIRFKDNNTINLSHSLASNSGTQTDINFNGTPFAAGTDLKVLFIQKSTGGVWSAMNGADGDSAITIVRADNTTADGDIGFRFLGAADFSGTDGFDGKIYEMAIWRGLLGQTNRNELVSTYLKTKYSL